MSEPEERRAPVQAGKWTHGHGRWPAGTIAWSEHLLAFEAYSRRFGISQSAERIAERGGFGYGELQMFLGCDPKTWKPL